MMLNCDKSAGMCETLVYSISCICLSEKIILKIMSVILPAIHFPQLIWGLVMGQQSELSPDLERASNLFLVENHGLGLRGADSHLSRFTLGCKKPQKIMSSC